MGTISRVTTWSTGDTLTAADLNGEFDNILSTANGSLNADNLGVTAGIASALKAVVLDSNKDFADGTGSNQIRNLTISGSLKIGTTFLPDASGGADLGSSSLEWGDLYIADDKYIKLGSDQNINIGYDETTTDSLKIAATEGAALAITLMADEGDDAGDEWKLNVADGGTITLGNDIASAGTYVTHLTLTPHATVASSTLSLAGGLTVAGATQANSTVTVGADDQGYDVKLFGDTASAYLLWDTSADKLLTAGGATIDILKDKLLIGGVAVTTTAAELNFLDTSSAGTVVASKAVVVDSNKDIASFRNVTLTGELDAATGDFSGDVDVDGTLEADAITLGGTALGSLYSPIAGSSSIVTVGTIGTGTWQGTAVASAYLDADTAHLSTTQTFSGAKTFSAAAQFSSTVTVGVDDTGYDVKFFGATSGSSLLWDESADDLIFTNAGLAVGSDATGDIYYRNSSGFLARLGASTDGYVLTTGGAGTIPAWEAAPGSGSFSGPGTSTENAIVRFTNTSGNSGDNSGILIDDSNNVTGAANVTLSGELDAATGDFSGDVDIDGTLETDALTIGGTALLANDTNNRVTTATGSGTFNGEANLTFDGSTLGVAGAVTITKNNDYGVSTYDGTNAGGTIGLGTLSADANGGWLLKNVYYNGSAWAVNNSSVGAGAMKFDGSGNIIWLTQASGSGLPAERMRILAGGGLTFNGDTAAANALDDYEEGTWTPVWKFGGASSGTVNTQTDNAAWYTKIGSMVTVWYRGALANSPSGSGSLVITGLPYTIQNTTNQYPGTGAWSNLITFGGGIAADGNPNSTFVNVEKLSSSTSTGVANVQHSDCTQYSQVRFILQYTV
jgi:fibronectin-binding autotransporter adhesin